MQNVKCEINLNLFLNVLTSYIDFNRCFMNRINISLRVLLIAVLFLITNSSYAQVLSNLYVFSQYQGAYTPITGGQVLGAAPTVGDSWTSAAISIPAVHAGGNIYTHAYVTSNGLLKLGGTAPSIYLYTGISTSPTETGSMHIAPFNADLNVYSNNASSEIRMQEIGNELVFQWKGFKRYGETEQIDFQVRINILNADILFVYQLVASAGSGTSFQPQVGIALSNSNYLAREVASNATSSWAASTAATANTATCRFTSSSTNPKQFTSGQVYKFSPNTCSSFSLGTTTMTNNTNVCGGTTQSFNVTGTPATAGYVTYQLQGSNDGVQFFDIPNVFGLPASTTPNYKQYRFKSKCLVTNDITYSLPVTINYSNTLTSTTGASLCGMGSANISATSSSPLISWFTSQIGGSLLATGANFTTPIINTTTSYFATALTTTNGQAIVGQGTSTNNGVTNPFYSNWANAHKQYLITAAELSAAGLLAGNITSLGITVTSGTTQIQNVNMKIAPTNATDVSAFLNPTFTQVYSAATYSPVVGLNNFTFTTPFVWDGVSNIVIDWCFDNLSSTSTINNTCQTDNTPYIASINVNRTSVTNTLICGNTSLNVVTNTIRPKFTFNGLIGCYGAREEVKVLVSTAAALDITASSSICNNSIKQLSVLAGANDYPLIKWEPATNLYTDAAATIPYIANAHATTVYFKSITEQNARIVAFGSNQATTCSNSDTSNIYVLPSAITINSVITTYCNSGIATIKLDQTLLGSNVTYQWQSSSDNITFTDISGATNSTYTTPNLLANTYYRLVLKNSSNSICLTSNAHLITISNPSLSALITDTLCGGGQGLLGATGNTGTNVKWYNSLTSNTILSVGNTYTTPFINSTTNFYAVPFSVTPNVVQVGTGTLAGSSTPYAPVSGGYGGMKGQYIITAAELTAAGLLAGPITEMSFEITSAAATTYPGFAVEMGHTTLTEFPATVSMVGGLTLVKNEASLTPIVGDNRFVFDQPFVWNGTSNIIVSTSWSNNTSNNSSSSVRYATYGSSTNYYAQSSKRDNVTSTVMLGTVGALGYLQRSSDRPNFKFSGMSHCNGVRTAVAAVVNPGPAYDITNDVTICNGTIRPLTVTTGAANYQEFTWSPATNLFTDAAATIPYLANTSATTVYFKQTTGGLYNYAATAKNFTTDCQSVDTVHVTVLPAQINVNILTDKHCRSGSSAMTLSPSFNAGSAVIQWQESLDNTVFTDIVGANGVTYNSPVNTVTKYYRVKLVVNSVACSTTYPSDTLYISQPDFTTINTDSSCTPKVFNLSVVPSQSNVQVKWYDALVNGNLLGTGNSFTTPLLNTSTTYYALPYSGSNGDAIVSNGTLVTQSGASAYSPLSPYAYHYGNYKHQFLILASELTAQGFTAGNITSLAFDVASVGATPGTFNNFNVSLMPTSLAALTSTFQTTGAQVVFTGNVTPGVGASLYNFTAPYVWDGISNIIVQTCYNNNNNGVVASSADVKYDNTSFVSAAVWRNDGTQTSCTQTTASYTYSTRPKMTLSMANECLGTMHAVEAKILPFSEAVISPAGNVGLCNGNSTLLTAVNTATRYVWFKNGTAIPNSNNSTLNVTDSGHYYLVTINGICSDTSDIVNVNFSPMPIFSLGQDINFCPGTSTSINAPNNLGTILWDDNSINPTRVVNTPGTYYVKITNNFGCSATDTINAIHFIHNAVNLGRDTVICPNMPFSLDAGAYTSYLWNTGNNTRSISIADTGWYSVKIVDQNGCTSSDTMHVGFRNYASVDGFGFTPYFYEEQGKVKFAPINPVNVVNYLWDFGDGTTSTLVSPLHVYSQEGVYLVKLSVTNGFCPAEIDTQTINLNFTVGIDPIENTTVKLYPNPAQEKITIELVNSSQNIAQVMILDNLGRRFELPYQLEANKVVINTQLLPSSIYTARVLTKNGSVVNLKFEILK